MATLEWKAMSIRLPLDLAQALELAANAEGESQVVLIRQALRSQLTGHRSAKVRRLAQGSNPGFP